LYGKLSIARSQKNRSHKTSTLQVSGDGFDVFVNRESKQRIDPLKDRAMSALRKRNLDEKRIVDEPITQRLKQRGMVQERSKRDAVQLIIVLKRRACEDQQIGHLMKALTVAAIR
jgi:hypothetical protein